MHQTASFGQCCLPAQAHETSEFVRQNSQTVFKNPETLWTSKINAVKRIRSSFQLICGQRSSEVCYRCVREKFRWGAVCPRRYSDDWLVDAHRSIRPSFTVFWGCEEFSHVSARIQEGPDLSTGLLTGLSESHELRGFHHWNWRACLECGENESLRETSEFVRYERKKTTRRKAIHGTCKTILLSQRARIPHLPFWSMSISPAEVLLRWTLSWYSTISPYHPRQRARVCTMYKISIIIKMRSLNNNAHASTHTFVASHTSLGSFQN